MFFFFFQAEDGIRDIGVTGVQTCALPIFWLILVEAAAAAVVTAYLVWQDITGVAADLGVAIGVTLFALLAVVVLASVGREIGRASCRGRVEISVVAVSFKKKKSNVTRHTR